MKNRPEMPAAARQPIGESGEIGEDDLILHYYGCLLYTSPSPRD